MNKDRKGQRKLEDFGRWLLHAVKEHSLEKNRIAKLAGLCFCLPASSNADILYQWDGDQRPESCQGGNPKLLPKKSSS